MEIRGYELTEEKPTWFIIEKELRKEMCVPCMDNPKFADNGEEVVLIMEPYNVSMRGIKELTEFCEIRGLEFQIWGSSFHSPGNAFGICIHYKDDHKRKDSQFWINKIKKIIDLENSKIYLPVEL